MTADELRSLRAYPRYFELDGVPMRIMSRSSLPQQYAGHGKWETFAARHRLLIYGKLITTKRFASLCRHVDQILERGSPFIDSVDV